MATEICIVHRIPRYNKCITVKMAATVIVLHGGQKETPFPLLTSLGQTSQVAIQ